MSGPWRRRCPDGHASYEYRTAGPQSRRDEPAYVCKQCGEVPHLVDAKTGEEIHP